MTRANHYAGRSAFTNEGYFRGAMRFVAVYERALSVADQASATTAFRIGLAGATTLAACEPVEEAACPAGTYVWANATTGDVCRGCPAGTVSARVGAVGVEECEGTACPEGYWCPAGTSEARKCEMNYYCPAGSSTARGNGQCGLGFARLLSRYVALLVPVLRAAEGSGGQGGGKGGERQRKR